ncbi:hypothetical protein K431DRAFT_283253 [Polychaeton citri CBS 116435]|uniref:Zn(2)-C6 fungal-type domain-containing protein n=1 Tax=Polychaeton citri CBS 116435 TaxID=1314669 RepID=A0A9P4UQP9_9PEZI|nr:hypothetical protein K431DRAFT_283253 [Polychaeton citri CBS 116435]
MAAMQRSRTASSVAQDHTAAPEHVKLRSSCHACAASKLKCSQEKPTCSRCAKRGLTCEYVAAKRGGRKPNKRPSTSTNAGDNAFNNVAHANDKVHLPPQANQFTTPSLTPGSTIPLRSPEYIQQSPHASGSESSVMLQDFFGPVDHELSSVSTATVPDLNDYFTSSASFTSKMADANMFGTDLFPDVMYSGSSNASEVLSDPFPSFEDTVSDLFTLCMPDSAPKNSIFPSVEGQNYQGTRTTKPPHSCLVRALGFMEQLSPASCLGQTAALPTVKAVIAQNEGTIEAVSKMLDCTCSQDGYLLAVMSLIIFKILGWYAAAACQKPSSQHSQASSSRQSSPSEQMLRTPSVAGSYRLHGDDSSRTAAQLVLIELHRVRRLIDQVSSRLKSLAVKRDGGEEPEVSGGLDFVSDMSLPFSATMYNQLDAALVTRLRALSLEMIDRLRRS